MVDLDDGRLLGLLVQIEAEVPADVDRGDRVGAVDLGGVQLVTTAGTFLIDPHGLVMRLWPVPGVGTEITRWCGGTELAREIIRDRL